MVKGIHISIHIYIYIISVLCHDDSLNMIQFNLQSLKFDWKFPPRRFKISAQVMNHTCDTGDRNLIKMSFEQRGFQNMYVRSSIFLSLCLSWL